MNARPRTKQAKNIINFAAIAEAAHKEDAAMERLEQRSADFLRKLVHDELLTLAEMEINRQQELTVSINILSITLAQKVAEMVRRCREG